MGLARKFFRVFLYHLLEKPEWTFGQPNRRHDSDTIETVGIHPRSLERGVTTPGWRSVNDSRHAHHSLPLVEAVPVTWPRSSWQMEAYLVFFLLVALPPLASAHLLSLVLQPFEDTKYQHFAFSDSVSQIWFLIFLTKNPWEQSTWRFFYMVSYDKISLGTVWGEQSAAQAGLGLSLDSTVCQTYELVSESEHQFPHKKIWNHNV